MLKQEQKNMIQSLKQKDDNKHHHRHYYYGRQTLKVVRCFM